MPRKPDRVFLTAEVLLASTHARHPDHDAVVNSLETLTRSGVEPWISRQVLRDYLTLAGLQTASAIADVRLFERTFHVAEDGPGVTSFLLNLCHTLDVPAGRMPEANVVATMLAWNVPRLLTVAEEKYSTFRSYVGIITPTSAAPNEPPNEVIR